MNRNRTDFLLADILIVSFVIFTLGIKAFDVQAIGPNGTEIGFATINAAVRDNLSYNKGFYIASEVVGYFALLLAAGFALLGLYQLIKRKSLLKVDKSILVLGVFLLLVMLFYILFNSFVVNYRPILIDGELEPGYPSSHTMLAICVFYMCSQVLMEITKDPMLAGSIRKVLLALMVLEVGLRFLSGVHWLTDIVGAILLSLAICTMFNAVLTTIRNIQAELDRQNAEKKD